MCGKIHRNSLKIKIIHLLWPSEWRDTCKPSRLDRIIDCLKIALSHYKSQVLMPSRRYVYCEEWRAMFQDANACLFCWFLFLYFRQSRSVTQREF